jgi:hypothetical protein
MNVKKLVMSTSLVALLLGTGTVACGGSEDHKADAAAEGAEGKAAKGDKAKGEKAKGEKAKGEEGAPAEGGH